MPEPRQHSDNKTIRKHRERPPIRRHLPNNAIGDALPNELQQWPMDETQEVPPYRRYGATEDTARFDGYFG